MRDSIRHFIAEFVGTFALVFLTGAAATGAAMRQSPTAILEAALVHGFVLGALVTAMIRFAGHFNPAVTLGFMAARRIEPVMGGVFIIAQLMAATLAGYALLGALPDAPAIAAQLGGQTIASEVSAEQAIAMEAIGTFALVFTIFGSAVDPKSPRQGGLAIGLVAAGATLALGGLTGGSLNPARSFGPSMASGQLAGQVVYWTGPTIGAIIAALLYDQLFIRRGVDSALHGAVQPTRDT